MKELLEFASKVVPPLKLYPEWVQLLVCAWLVFSAMVVSVLIFKYKPVQGGNPGALGVDQSDTPVTRDLPPLSQFWPATGDHRIDEVLARLNSLEKRGSATEPEVSSALRQFFQRPVFRHIEEESPDSAAYVFGHGERLLDHYQPFYEDSKDASEAIGLSKTRLIKLQQVISRAASNDQFFVQRTFSRFTNDRSQFIAEFSKQPGKISLMDSREANETLRELREALEKVGI
jgi:hypothetical protein